MIFYAMASRAMLRVYQSAGSSEQATPQDLEARFASIRDQIVLTRCTASAAAYDRYLALLANHVTSIDRRLSLTEAERAGIAEGYPGEPGLLHERLAAMRMAVAVSDRPEVASAFRAVLDATAQLLDAPELPVQFALDGPAALEAELNRDPSRADLWVATARAQGRAGNWVRARQLMRRMCASNFPQRTEAQSLLARWIEQETAA